MIKKYMPQIEEVIKEHNIDTNSILDYGCGKAQHHPENWNAYKYDQHILYMKRNQRQVVSLI